MADVTQNGYPTDAEAPGIFIGAPVSVRGLQGAAEYNGSKGTVTGGPWDNGRYEVTIPQDGGGEAKVLALKPTNFQLDLEALQEYLVKKRAERPKRDPPLENLELLWMKGKGLSAKGLAIKTAEVPQLESDCVLLRVDKFSFSQMSLGYLMKGYTRSFSAYHNFFKHAEEGLYRSACWGYATVVESYHPKVPVGTRLFGLVPPSQYHHQKILRCIPAGKNGDPPLVELAIEGMPFNMRRFQEYEVVQESSQGDQEIEDWKIALKEIYTMAFFMDEQLLVDTGQINSVIISCASSKTALALAYCLRMRGNVIINGEKSSIEREMTSVVGLTSKEHLEFAKSTELYHEVLTYEELERNPERIPVDKTVVYMDFKCDGALRQAITLRLGTNLMYNMVLGPAVFAKKMKDQLFEKRAREVLFDESTWRERRRMVAEVTKTGRNEKLRDSYQDFVEKMRQYIKLKHVCDTESLRVMYNAVYSNTASPSEAFICSLHPNEFAVEQIWAE
jgi:hypothetical protein